MRMDYNKNNIKKQVKDDDPLPPAVRTEYATKYGPLVDEGIADLQKAISLKPDYDDAMAYLEPSLPSQGRYGGDARTSGRPCRSRPTIWWTRSRRSSRSALTSRNLS